MANGAVVKVRITPQMGVLRLIHLHTVELSFLLDALV